MSLVTYIVAIRIPHYSHCCLKMAISYKIRYNVRHDRDISAVIPFMYWDVSTTTNCYVLGICFASTGFLAFTQGISLQEYWQGLFRHRRLDLDHYWMDHIIADLSPESAAGSVSCAQWISTSLSRRSNYNVLCAARIWIEPISVTLLISKLWTKTLVEEGRVKERRQTKVCIA